MGIELGKWSNETFYISILGRLGFVDVIVSNILATKTNDAVFNASLNLLICLSEELDTAKDHINNSKEFPAGIYTFDYFVLI